VPTKKKNVIRTSAASVLAIGAVTAAGVGSAQAAAEFPEFEIDINRQAIERTLDVTKERRDYRQAWEQAKKLDVEPKDATLSPTVALDTAEEKTKQLEQKVEKAKEPAYGTPESVGVSTGTLDAIASCESGGDPTAVDASGTYRGKYQFDLGTWASVGGSGDPAAAPEEEQDYRAALLYSQSGSSPWPVCGQ